MLRSVWRVPRRAFASDLVSDALAHAAPADAAAASADARLARAKHLNLKISPTKLRWVAHMCARRPYTDAVLQLQLARQRKAAAMVKRVLDAARGNAVHQFSADVARLRVAHVSVGRAPVLKRVRRHARNRVGSMTRPRAHLFVALEEVPLSAPLRLPAGRRARQRLRRSAAADDEAVDDEAADAQQRHE